MPERDRPVCHPARFNTPLNAPGRGPRTEPVLIRQRRFSLGSTSLFTIQLLAMPIGDYTLRQPRGPARRPLAGHPRPAHPPAHRAGARLLQAQRPAGRDRLRPRSRYVEKRELKREATSCIFRIVVAEFSLRSSAAISVHLRPSAFICGFEIGLGGDVAEGRPVGAGDDLPKDLLGPFPFVID